MKKIILIFLALFICEYAYADFVVFYYTETEEVLFISDNEKEVRLSEYEKTKISKAKIKGDIRDYELTESFTDYKLKGGKLIINTKKISAREDILDEDLDRLKNLKSLQTSAKTKLIELGLTEEEFKSLIE